MKKIKIKRSLLKRKVRTHTTINKLNRFILSQRMRIKLRGVDSK